jgi:hypothetical protein
MLPSPFGMMISGERLGHELAFGVFLTPASGSPKQAVQLGSISPAHPSLWSFDPNGPTFAPILRVLFLLRRA